MITETTRDGETLRNGALTKKRITELADRALRYGYFVSGGTGQAHGSRIAVTCPLAGREWSDTHTVGAELDQYSREGLNVRRTVIRALVDHFDPDNYPAGYDRSEHLCAGMRPIVRTERAS